MMPCDWKDIVAVFVAGFGLGGLVVFLLLEPHIFRWRSGDE